MKRYIIFALLILSVPIRMYATLSTCKDSTVLLADETTLIYCKNEAKIDCSNAAVFDKIFKTHGTLFKSFTCTWEWERKVPYKHYIAYLNKYDADIIKAWAKNNL